MKNLTIVFAIVLAGLVMWQMIGFQNKDSMNNQIAHKFIKAINEKEIEKMSALMTDDHKFIDSQGNELAGKERMKEGWKDYFKFFPAYKIEIKETFEKGETVAMFGFAGEQRWRLPASWKAVVQNGKIKLWQVFADTKIPFEMIDKKSDSAKSKKVTSIGGIFFKSKDPNKLKDWYKKHLGLDTDQYGTNFEWRQATDSSKKGFTQWSPFSEKTKYFEPSNKDFMINYRVENLELLVEQLKKDGVKIVDKIETFEYGKFVRILDLEDNKIELWEPNDVEYDKLVIGRTK